MEEQALFEAARTGDANFLDRVQDTTILTRRIDPQGDTACHVALKSGELGFAAKIAERHPPILRVGDAEGNTVLHWALKMGRTEFFKECVQLVRKFLGRHVGGKNDTVEEKMQQAGDAVLGYLSELFGGQPGNSREGGAAPSEERERELEQEAKLFSRSAVNRGGESLLYVAAERVYRDIVTMLLQTPVLSRTDGPKRSTALHVAARVDRGGGMVKEIVTYKKELARVQDGDGNTPLHVAVMSNDLSACGILLDASVTFAGPHILRIGNKDGFSAVHLAAKANHVKVVQLCVQRNISACTATTNQGQNILHLAVKYKSTDVVDFIAKDVVKALWFVNHQDKEGNTPLHIAALNGDHKMLRTLAASPVARQDLKNSLGRTYYDILKEQEEAVEKKKGKLMEDMKDFRSGLLVMATLITTITFTAAFTVPGGFENDGPDEGMATLQTPAAFKVFLASDTASMCSSIVAVAALILFSVTLSTPRRLRILKVAIGSIAVSLIFMLVAFEAGVWVVIGPKCRWLALLIAVTTSCTPLVLTAVLGSVAWPFRYRGRFKLNVLAV